MGTKTALVVATALSSAAYMFLGIPGWAVGALGLVGFLGFGGWRISRLFYKTFLRDMR